MSFAESDLAIVKAAARDRAPDGRRLVRFRWAWVDGAGWLIPRAPRGGETSVSADFRVASGNTGAFCAYRVAHGVRQDLWRALASLRGFWPVVRVAPADGLFDVTAGGFLPGPVPAGLVERIVMLNTAQRRRLWTGWAGADTGTTGD